MMATRTGEWLIVSGSGEFARYARLSTALWRAREMAADTRSDVTVSRNGHPAVVLTAAMIWTHVSGADVAAAIEKIESA
jgi:PHD/YefM family antitoxin component YafN of YafNO toxin-antitoxin module